MYLKTKECEGAVFVSILEVDDTLHVVHNTSSLGMSIGLATILLDAIKAEVRPK
jgi:hypothetical protein